MTNDSTIDSTKLVEFLSDAISRATVGERSEKSFTVTDEGVTRKIRISVAPEDGAS